ncbi:proline racemase family protein [Desulfosporosinus metallidurans]|uniref:Proline racemase n=1 Tax=Desulfosporosinus metallidurans TaxID=1888891 RepID=A0A1Q8QGY8_9FIRM|nr:proline racemase family protein [Desulfosporosinus metallidurans]OLN26619.1 Proline racemase [Desulfosporosinus metallidurans]
MVDSHTMGEPTRIVTGGAPCIIGKTMMEKKIYMEKELDWLRKTLMNAPRGTKICFDINDLVKIVCEMRDTSMINDGR